MSILISKTYQDMLKKQHKNDKSWNNYSWALKDSLPKILDLVKENSPEIILDYGSGSAGGFSSLSGLENVLSYDPAIVEFSKNNKPSDFVICIDVLEHIEPDFLENVLKDLSNVVKNKAFFSIANTKAASILNDGRNAHLIVETFEWWKNKLEEKFNIIESYTKRSNSFFILSKK